MIEKLNVEVDVFVDKENNILISLFCDIRSEVSTKNENFQVRRLKSCKYIFLAN